jgi:hypothetical protein
MGACELSESIRSLRGGERRIFEATFETNNRGELPAHLKRMTQALQLKPDESAPWGNYFASPDGAFRYTASTESVEVQLESSPAHMSDFLATLIVADLAAAIVQLNTHKLTEVAYGVSRDTEYVTVGFLPGPLEGVRAVLEQRGFAGHVDPVDPAVLAEQMRAARAGTYKPPPRQPAWSKRHGSWRVHIEEHHIDEKRIAGSLNIVASRKLERIASGCEAPADNVDCTTVDAHGKLPPACDDDDF